MISQNKHDGPARCFIYRCTDARKKNTSDRFAIVLNTLADALHVEPSFLWHHMIDRKPEFGFRSGDAENSIFRIGRCLLSRSRTEHADVVLPSTTFAMTSPAARLMERVAACYASKTPVTGAKWGARRRKAGMWSILAADQWLKAGKPSLASACLEEAERLYADVLEADGVFPMPEMQSFVDNLRHAVKVEYLEARGFDARDESPTEDLIGIEEISEKLDKRNYRRLLIRYPT